MRLVDGFPEGRGVRRSDAFYDELVALLDKDPNGAVRLERGVDFDRDDELQRVRARTMNALHNRGLKVRSRILDDAVHFQLIEPQR